MIHHAVCKAGRERVSAIFAVTLSLSAFAFLTGCDPESVRYDFQSNFGGSAEATSNSQARFQASQQVAPVGMDSGEMTINQFQRLNYLGGYQSRKAMNSWSEGRYPYKVVGNEEFWKVPDQIGTCVALAYANDGTYLNRYTFTYC